MSAPVPSPGRFALAVGTAAAATTIAVGVTAASLLGWFRPADQAPALPAPPPTDVLAPVVEAAIEPPAEPLPPSPRHHHDDDDDDEGDDDDY